MPVLIVEFAILFQLAGHGNMFLGYFVLFLLPTSVD